MTLGQFNNKESNESQRIINYLSLKGIMNKLKEKVVQEVLPQYYYHVDFWFKLGQLEKIIDEIESLDLILP